MLPPLNVAQTRLSVFSQGAVAGVEKQRVRTSGFNVRHPEPNQHRQECLCHTSRYSPTPAAGGDPAFFREIAFACRNSPR
jgi:hypothetical protein